MYTVQQNVQREMKELHYYRQMSKPYSEVAPLLIQPLLGLLFACNKLVIKPSRAGCASPWELDVQ